MFRLSDFSLIVFDFDGVFTDNLVIVDEVGKESVICSRADGLWIGILKRAILKRSFIYHHNNYFENYEIKKIK
jgi:3-deoxy-D-manno-octulosonate 8-phosphate phosphatase KdsC-like HAD superfamily phosphatase